jgi:hypothetical protein
LRQSLSGDRLEEFVPRDIFRILVGACEMRYEPSETRSYILRVWHNREDR